RRDFDFAVVDNNLRHLFVRGPSSVVPEFLLSATLQKRLASGEWLLVSGSKRGARGKFHKRLRII
ncbi:MAG: hypothetical protein PVG00_09470, partial [Desulfobacterales bacterium]